MMVMYRRLVLLGVLLVVATGVAAQSVYRYRGDDGRWHYSDKPPPDGRETQVSVIERINLDPRVIITRETNQQGATIFAENEFHSPVEFEIRLIDTRNVGGNLGEVPMRVVLPAAGKTAVLDVIAAQPGKPMAFRYEYKYMLGQPDVKHNKEYLYGVPYAVGQRFLVSQAYPIGITHTEEHSRYAVDFAMPEGTAVHAARAGTVVAIAFRSFSGGVSEADAPKANLVRIVHDDGTMATYAHLALDSVRVRPGDRVERGEYIASSGNTGFSTGPHLHFAVDRNVGFSLESIPVLFHGAGGRPVRAETGQYLQSF